MTRLLALSIAILICTAVHCQIEGCTDPEALNFDESSETDNGSCIYSCAELELSVEMMGADLNGFFNLCETDEFGAFILGSQLEAQGINLAGLSINWGDEQFEEFSIENTNPYHSYEEPGIYNLEITLTNEWDCDVSAEYTVNAGSLTEIEIVSENENYQVCTGEELVFGLSGFENNPESTTYTLYFNDNSNPEFFNHPPPDSFSHQFLHHSCGHLGYNDVENAYVVKVIAEGACGDEYAYSVPIYVSGMEDNAELDFTTVPDTEGSCIGAEYTFVNTSSGFVNVDPQGCAPVNPSDWNILPDSGWEIYQGSLEDESYIGVRFLDDGIYVIQLTDDNLCASSDYNEQVFISQIEGTVEGFVLMDDEVLDGMNIGAFAISEENGEFELLMEATTNTDGSFGFILPEGQFIFRTLPNEDEQSTMMPMYSNEVWDWEYAEIFEISCCTEEFTAIELHEMSSLQDPMNVTIQGSLVYRDVFKSFFEGDPIPGIPIIIEKDTTDSEPVSYTTTDFLGGYSFAQLPVGDYKIHVDMPGLPMFETHFFTVDGEETELYDLNFYADSLDMIYISDLVSVEEHMVQKNPFLIYPNPTRGRIFIEGKNTQISNWEMAIFDAQGREIELKADLFGRRVLLDLREQSSGLYHCVIWNENEKFSGKIMLDK